MPDYADKILSEDMGGQERKKKDYSDILLTPGVKFVEDPHKPGQLAPMQTGREPTGEVSTITGKPMPAEPVDFTSKKPGFGALVETGVVDDPQTQIDILSKRMGIPRERFGVVAGDIVYRGDNGILYDAMPDKAKKMVAQQIPRIPAMVGGVVGAPFGPGAAAVLAAGGEAARKLGGKLIYDEPQTTLGNVKDIAIEGVLAYGGEKLGGTLIKGVDRMRGKQAASLMTLSGVERASIKPEAIKEMQRLSKKFGIDLFVPQATGSHELIARFSLLGDLPVTADRMGRARLKQYGEINKAVNDWLTTFAPATTTPGEAGRRAVEAAVAAMKAPKQAARKASREFYDQAREVGGVDIGDTVAKIENMLNRAPKGGAENKTLNRIKKMLTRKTTDAQGNEIIISEDRIVVLDKVKKEINSMWKKDPKTSPDVDAQRAINETLESMLSQVDEQVPVYAEARKAYRESIQESGFEELGKTKVGQLAKMEGDKVENAAKAVFSPSQSSPEIVSITKEAIVREGGQDAWDSLLRVHLKNKVREVVKTNTMNIGGMLRKKLHMDIDQRDILEVAMTPEQYSTFTDFMKLLERTGLTAGKESTTGPRQVSLSQLGEEATGIGGKITRAAAYPLYTWKRIIADFRLKIKTEKYLSMLADAMIDQKNTTRFRAMLQLKPGSQELINQVSVFLTSLGGGTYLREKKKYTGPMPMPLGQQFPRKSLTPQLTR